MLFDSTGLDATKMLEGTGLPSSVKAGQNTGGHKDGDGEGALDGVEDIQMDLLLRLRVIEHLQGLTYPRIIPAQDNETIVRALNWICSSLVTRPRLVSVSAALSVRQGRVTLYLAHNGSGGDREIQRASKHLLSTLREVITLYDQVSLDVLMRILLRMVIRTSSYRIQRKLELIRLTDVTPRQTAFSFNGLVSMWLSYRPEGECSPGIVRLVRKSTKTRESANEILVQLFMTLIHQSSDAEPEKMPAGERYAHFGTLITVCCTLLHSTFFNDLQNHHSFRLSLRNGTRAFANKLYRRIERVAAHKFGAIDLAGIGVPFLRTVLGPAGVTDFLAGGASVSVVHVTDLLSHAQDPPLLRKTVHWPCSTADGLPALLGLLDEDDGHGMDFEDEEAEHSRKISTFSSMSSSSSAATSAYSDLCRLDNHLRAELLDSALLSSAWEEGAPTELRLHAPLQLLSYLFSPKFGAGADPIFRNAIGTSKPMCRACVWYLAGSRTRPRHGEDEGEENRWIHSHSSLKVSHDWMVPQECDAETLEVVVDGVQREMERVVEEVAFDCYL